MEGIPSPTLIPNSHPTPILGQGTGRDRESRCVCELLGLSSCLGAFNGALLWLPLLSPCTAQGGTPGVGVGCPLGMAVESYTEQGDWG